MTDKEASRGELRELGFVDSRVFNGNTNRNTFVPVRLYHPPFLFLRRAPRTHPLATGVCVEATNNSCTSVCRTSARRTVVDAQSKKHPERDESRGGTAAATATAVAFE